MTVLNIEGIGRVTPVDPNFFNLSLDEQAKQVDELISAAKNAGLIQDPPKPEEQLNPAEAAAKENRGNLATSAANAATNLVQPILHPIQTVENIGTIGKGILQKVGALSGKDAIPAADSVWDALVNRYGSAAAIKKTIHEDPVGFLMDASVILSGGGALAARAPGIAGEVGRAVSTVGSAVDPVAMAGRAVAPVVRGAGNVAAEAAGITTGAGAEALKTAARSGAAGGDAAAAFKGGMSGAVDATTVVNEARSALNQLRAERGTAYREGMAKIGADNQALDFGKIDNAIEKVAGVKNYKGQDLSPTTQAVRESMTTAVEDWKQLPPAQFHTAEGLDALKQKLGDIRDGTMANTPERVVADQIYQGVRKTIIDQAPEYAKVMKGYEQASDIIREIEKTLSLNPKATIDTSLRKLQSVLRNNVSTNYGRRAELVDFLTRAGAPHLMEHLAGQALSSVAPRGLSRLAATGEGAGALTSLMLGHPAAAATLGAAVTGSSPALMGGLAYGLGSASRFPGRALGQTSFQLGRAGQ